MSQTSLTIVVPLAAALLASPAVRAADPSAEDRWPGWRGDGQGIARGARLPLEWTASRNIAWKAEIPGRGLSSPIVWGDRLFLTTAIEGDVVPGAKAVKHVAEGQEFVHPDATGADRRHTFKLLSLDAKDGRVLWERTVWEGTPVDSRHKKASFASPTAATDGERVYAYFGSEGLYAYDFEGKLAWKFDPGVVGTMGVGVGTSPLLYRDLLILLCDEDNGEKSTLVALDRRTGKEKWRVARKIEVSWATPVIVSAAGRDELVTAGNQLVQAYDPATGRELWRMKGLESNAVTTPLVGDGVVVVSSGYPSKVTVAVKPGGSGDITDSPQVLWRYNKGSAYVPSPILYDGHVYLLTDKGLLTCLDARTGEVRYEGARPPVTASFTASPVAVNGHLLLTSQDGDTFVVKAGPRFEVVGTNPLGEPIGGASAAAAGGRLYIRGEKHLFAIAAPAGS
ncbi:MAG TPA: PQQ-binding-like beta-propeller repeat protein [Vicinamibacteria bacterium]|nr:PQQ-binding-like beta-propeller repeat protein [Vicinamibacteria bacterium]